MAVVAEGADWVLVNKPAHQLVHPTRPGGPPTLWDGLRGLLAYELANGGQVSLVHRLDRETSGLLLVATTAPAARRFARLWAAGLVRKEYAALVRGWPDWETCEVDAPLLRAGRRGPTAVWLKQAVHADGAPARTCFEVRRRFVRPLPDGGGDGRFALLRAQPLTGRLHQIRVHAAHAGYPLVGDKIYGPDESCYLRFIAGGWTPDLARTLLLNRHALHACRLAWPAAPGGDGDGPREGAGDWTCPLPADLAAFLGDPNFDSTLDAPFTAPLG